MKLTLNILLEHLDDFAPAGEVDAALAAISVADVLPFALFAQDAPADSLLVDGTDVVLDGRRVSLVGEGGEAELFMAVRSVMTQFNSWALDARRVYQMGGGLEDLLQVSSSVLTDHVVVLDSSFQLMAATKGAPLMDAAGYAELLSSGLEMAMRVCSFDGTLFAHVLMLPAGPQLTQGSKDVLDLFMAELAPFLLHGNSGEAFLQPHDYLFERLISDAGMPESEARMEAYRLQIPYEGSFRLLCLESKADVSHMVRELSGCRVSTHNGVVIALAMDELPQLPEGTVAGCSREFGSLSDLRFAFMQALFALECRRGEESAAAAAVATSATKLFDDCLIEFVLQRDGADAEFLEFCLEDHPVARMRRESKERETREYEILVEYLRNERRATIVAEHLGMHRNNVLYHVKRISTGYDLDLDDPDVRFEAQMVIRLLENVG